MTVVTLDMTFLLPLVPRCVRYRQVVMDSTGWLVVNWLIAGWHRLVVTIATWQETMHVFLKHLWVEGGGSCGEGHPRLWEKG